MTENLVYKWKWKIFFKKYVIPLLHMSVTGRLWFVPRSDFTDASLVVRSRLLAPFFLIGDWSQIPIIQRRHSSIFQTEQRMASSMSTLLRHSGHPNYLGVIHDRTQTYKRHPENTAAKMRTLNNILHKLYLGCTAETLRTSSFSWRVQRIDLA